MRGGLCLADDATWPGPCIIMYELKEEIIRKLERELNFYSARTENLKELLASKKLELAGSQLEYEKIKQDLARTDFLVALLKKYGEMDE